MISFRAELGEVEYALQGEPSSLVAEMKAALEQQAQAQAQTAGAVPAAAQQKWIYQGRVLQDSSTLEACGVVEGHVVHVIKSATVASGVPGPSIASPEPQTAAASVQPMAATYVASPAVQALIAAFDSSMRRMLGGNSEEVARGAVLLLAKVAANIVAHPMEEKYRKIKTSSAALARKVLAAQGGADCLRALGFAEEGEEWVLRPSAERWDALVAAKAKLETFQNAIQSAPTGTPASTPVSASPAPAPGSSTAAVAPAPPSSDEVLAMRELLRGLMAIQQQQQQPGNGV